MSLTLGAIDARGLRVLVGSALSITFPDDDSILTAVNLLVASYANPEIFVFRPSDPSPQGNIYASFSALATAAALVNGFKVVQFDNSLAACSIAAGTYDFGSPTRFEGPIRSRLGDGSGAGAGPCVPVAIADNAFLANVYEFRDVAITCATTTFCIDAPNNDFAYIFSGGTGIVVTGGGFFIRQNNAKTLGLLLQDLSAFKSGIAARADNAGTVVAVETYDASAVINNTLSGIAGSTWFGLPFGTGSSINPAQPAIPGGALTVIPVGAASNLAYIDTAPLLGAASVQAAIDALKSLTNAEVLRWSDAGVLAIATTYLTMGGSAASVTENNVKQRIRRACSYTNIIVDASAAPGATHSTVYTVRKNGVATTLTVTLGAADLTKTATVAAVSFAAGDFISLEQVPDGIGNITANPRIALF